MTIWKKLWSMLDADERLSAGVLLGLMLIGMLLETLGVGLVIPALALMTQADLPAKYPALAPWLAALGNPSNERLVVGGMLTLTAVYAVKTVFLGFLALWQARFVYNLQARLSTRLFSSYLHQPYTFHLQRNSAQLIRNTTNLVGEVTGVVEQGLMLVTELLVLFGIALLLLLVEPLGALVVVSTLGLAGWTFHRVTRARVLRWGGARQRHEGLRIQHIQQGLGGAKEMKVLGRETQFVIEYEQHNTGSARIGQLQSTLKALPRLWLELLAVTGLAGLVVVMIAQGKPLEALLPILGLFAAAAFRFMPSVNRVLLAVQTMRFFLPGIDNFYAELSLLDPARGLHRRQSLAFGDALSLEHVTFQYPAAESHALVDVSLSIRCGDSVGFIGGSGAGKSTLVDIILGLLTPTAGTVKVDGVDIQGRLRDWQDQVGYVPQSIYLTDDSLRRNIAFGLPPEEIDEESVLRAVRASQLDKFIGQLPLGLDTIVGERGIRLSGGQRQRIGIARALYHDPAVLVLDEATSSLDSETERGVMEAVRALHGEKTILIVAHRLSTVEHCDRLYRFEGGRLVQEGDSTAMLGIADVTAAAA